MTERTITVEDLPAEFERLAAMATSPSHTNIWNSAADMLRAALSSDYQGGRGEADIREHVELLLTALLELLPVQGSWTAGYTPEDRALPEEWAAAAVHFCDVHKALVATDQPPAPRGLSAEDRKELRPCVPKDQAEAQLREVEAERDAAIKEADRLKAAHRQAEQQLRSLLTDLQGEAERIIDSGSWETPAAAAGRLEELIRKYAALSSTEQKGAGR